MKRAKYVLLLAGLIWFATLEAKLYAQQGFQWQPPNAAPAGRAVLPLNPLPIGQVEPPIDAYWRPRAAQATTDAIAQTMLFQNGRAYVRFNVGPVPQARQQQGGFAPVLQPQAAAAPARSGLVEITFENGVSVESYPAQPGINWARGVYLRIQQFRVFENGVGWRQPQMVTLHFWEWDATVVNRQLSLTSKTDKQYGTSDGGPTEFVASIFNVPPGSVRCSRPSPQALANSNQAAPQPRPWRAQYNQVAPIVPRQ